MTNPQLRAAFETWVKANCSPPLPEFDSWYWQIFQAGAEAQRRAAEPSAPHAYEEALGEVWKALGQLSPAMVHNDAVNKIVETAYYAAENALYKAGGLKLVDGRLVVNRNGEQR